MQRPLAKFICSTMVLCTCLPCFAQKPAASLKVRMPESEFKTDTAIRLDAIVYNSSTEDLRVWKVSTQVDGMAEAYLDVKVCDAEGKSLPRIDGATIVKNGKNYGIGKRWLTRKGAIVRPNEELHDFLLLSSLFDLRKPGTYVVAAEADIPRPILGPKSSGSWQDPT